MIMINTVDTPIHSNTNVPLNLVTLVSFNGWCVNRKIKSRERSREKEGEWEPVGYVCANMKKSD